MSFTFLHQEMIKDVKSLADAGKKYLDARAAAVLDNLCSDLEAAVANAKATNVPDFRWKTPQGVVIATTSSRNWKGTTNDFDPHFAEVTIDYRCRLEVETGRIVVKEGFTVATIRPVNGLGEKRFHFDVGVGGWEGQAGHPPFHFQFEGMIKDVPRLPATFFHPMDVLWFVLLEMHQEHWRKHLRDAQVKARIQHFSGRQRKRVITALESLVGRLAACEHPLLDLQRTLHVPLEF